MGNRILFTFLVILFFISVNADAQYIEGIITDKKTKLPLSRANLSVGEKGFVSNKLGEFRIKKVTGKIAVSHIGYETATLAIEPQKNFYIRLVVN